MGWRERESWIGKEIDRGRLRAALAQEQARFMALISPDTTAADIDYYTKVFRECIEAIAG